ncbi:MAG: DUF1588 domain-containing protein [Myxococcota bacterium]
MLCSARWALPLVFAGLLGCTGRIGSDATAGDPSPPPPAPAVPSEPGPPPPPDCTPALTSPPRLVRLSAEQYRATVSVLFGGRSLRLLELGPTAIHFTAPFGYARSSDRFSTYAGAAPLSELDADETWTAANVVAEAYAAQIQGDVLHCLGMGGVDAACLQPILAEMLSRLWSRPPTSEEVGEWIAELNATLAELDPPAAVLTLVRQALSSPSFLFRTELGEGGPLTSYERAAAIAFAITQQPPDDALWTAAAAGSLSTTAGVRAEVRRLLASPGELSSLRGFLNELLDVSSVLNVTKDATRFPKHNPAALLDDTQRVMEVLVREHARGGLLRALLTTDLVFARRATEESWGLTGGVSNDGEFLHAPGRSGIFTHPAWLAGYSENDHNHIVRRGRFLRERLLCGAVPSLPIGMVPKIEQSPGTSYRMKLEVHSKDPGCWACHQKMDPLGFAFESWDHLGRPQTMDNGAAVDPSGIVDSIGDASGPYADAQSLMAKLADSPEVQRCWVQQLFRYYLGREPTEADACQISQLAHLYAASGEDTMAVIEAIFTSPAYLNRAESP